MRKFARNLFLTLFWAILLLAAMWYEGYIPRYLARQVQLYFETNTDFRIHASNIQFSWPFTLHLSDLSIEDDSKHLSLESLEARISLRWLFSKQLVLRSLMIKNLKITSTSAEKPSQDSLDFNFWSELPLPLAARSFTLDGWQYGEQRFQPQIIKGNFALNPLEKHASIQLTSVDQPKASAHIEIVQDSLIVHDIVWETAGLEVKGLVHMDSKGRLDGTLLEACYHHPRGTVRGVATLTDTIFTPKWTLSCAYPAAQISGNLDVLRQEGNVRAELQYFLSKWQLEADFAENRLRFQLACDHCPLGETSIHNLQVEGGIENLLQSTKPRAFDLALRGYSHEPFLLATNGRLHLAENGINAEIDSINGDLFSENFATVNPFTVEYSPDNLIISPLHIQLERGALFLAFSKEQEHIQVATKMDDVPLPFFHPFLRAKNVTGVVSGDALFIANEETLKGHFQVNLQDIAIGDQQTVSPTLDCILEGQLEDGDLYLAGGLGHKRVDQVSLKGKIPLYDFCEEKTPLDFQLSGSGEIAPFIELLPMPSINLMGFSSFDIGLSGTCAAPILSGEISLEKGVFENIEVGAYFKDISANLMADPESQGKRWTLRKLSASDGRQGRLSASGWCDIDFERKLPFEMRVYLEHAHLVQLPEVQGWFNADLLLEGNAEGGKLSGLLDTRTMRFTLEDDPAPELEAIEIVYLNQPPDKKLPVYTLDDSEDRWPIALDLDVATPQAIVVEGKGLQSKWRGRVHITGTTRNPLVNGDIKIAQGEFQFRGKKIQIAQATVSFAGDPAKKTNIYLIASLDLNDVQIEAVIRGPIKNPNVTFHSIPAMSQHEILSWLLFNRGTSDISTLQNTQISHSLKSLQKQADSSPDVITKLQNAIGIDRIDFNHDDRGDANAVSMQVGKYISDGVLVSLNKSITAESNQIALEATLFRNFKVHAEVSDDSDDQLLLLWKINY